MGFPIDVTKTVTLDSSGSGTVKIGPTSSGQTWRITRASVQTSTAVKVPQALLYQGNKTTFISGTVSGSNDTDDALNVLLTGSGYIMCVWTGGDAGAVATLTVAGEQVD